MTTQTCQHIHTTDVQTHGYSGPVYVYPYTEENRAAHGNVCVTVRCRACGAERAELRNGRHEEVGTWGPSAAEVQRREEAARTARQRARDEADLAAYAASGRRIERIERIAGYDDDPAGIETVLQIRDTTDPRHTLRATRLDDILAAARQEDTGDGLVPVYRGIYLAATGRPVEYVA